MHLTGISEILAQSLILLPLLSRNTSSSLPDCKGTLLFQVFNRAHKLQLKNTGSLSSSYCKQELKWIFFFGLASFMYR
uniref:Secreted protein n=1 Tax=Calidris pygmaea TaxID=425635 RepID=A0A8C3K5G6_9CHAR